MTKTAWEQFTDLAGDRAVTVPEVEAAGIKHASSYLSQWKRMVPPRVEAAGKTPEGLKLYRIVQDKAPEQVDGLDAVLGSEDDHDTAQIHVLKGYTQDKPIGIRPKLTPTPSVGTTRSSSMDELVLQLADRLARSIAEQVQARLEDYLTQAIEAKLSPLPEAVRVEVELPLPAAPIKHKGDQLHVCIAGLLPQQTQLIKQEFGKDMRIDFIGSDHNPKSVREKLAHADAAFVMTKFIGHWLDKIAAESKVPVFQRITGGMTRLRDCLTSLYVSS